MGPGRSGGENFGGDRRLRRREDFLRVQNRGRKFVGHWLVFLYLRKEGVPCRLGITVSRRVGGAVVRNRVKRRIREIFRKNPEMFAGVGDLVVIGRRSSSKASFADIEEDFAKFSQCLKGKGPERTETGQREAG